LDKALPFHEIDPAPPFDLTESSVMRGHPFSLQKPGRVQDPYSGANGQHCRPALNRPPDEVDNARIVRGRPRAVSTRDDKDSRGRRLRYRRIRRYAQPESTAHRI
jgi:hypothetical protein